MKRIPYIDLAKGICILLVVLSHCEVYLPFAGLTAMRMPLYFTLSGLFFKDYGGLGPFARKKADKLLIPFLTFYAIGCLLFYAGKALFPSLLKNGYEGWSDILVRGTSFNTPIWFLLCLFWCNLWYALICRFISREWLRAAAVALLGALGVACCYWNVPTSLNLTSSLSALPFFCFGSMLRSRTSLLHSPPTQKSLALGIAGLLLAFGYANFAGEHHIFFYRNAVTGHPVMAYLLGALSVCSLLLVCKSIGSLPLISYVGRYSIIILATHYLWVRFYDHALPAIFGMEIHPLATFLAVFASSVVMIPLCRKFLPYVTAQKELLTPSKPVTHTSVQ